MRTWMIAFTAALAGVASIGCTSRSAVAAKPRLSATPIARKIVTAARGQLDDGTGYDPKYVKLSYPMGDPPKDIGVCTDVVVRALRPAGYDLQRLVHEDMVVAWKQYPRYPGITHPDPNIDHRRVPNLRVFFARHGATLTTKLKRPQDWRPGDIVTWKILGRLDHVGILSDLANDQGFPLVIHNAGDGPQEEDVLGLSTWTLNGHYRFPN